MDKESILWGRSLLGSKSPPLWLTKFSKWPVGWGGGISMNHTVYPDFINPVLHGDL